MEAGWSCWSYALLHRLSNTFETSVFQQLNSASFSTQKADHGGISSVFYLLWMKLFLSPQLTSPDTLSQAVFFSLLHFLHTTRNKTKEKKKEGIPESQVPCHQEHTWEVLVFQTYLAHWPEALCQLLWHSDNGDAPFLPAWMSHAIFTQSSGISSFRNFYWACANCIFLKAYNLARFEQISFSQKQQKAHPPTKAILSNLHSLSQLGGGKKGGGCYHFSK